MRRRSVLMLVTPLVAAGLIGAGCGGGDTKTSTTSGPPSSSDAAAILGAITAGDQTSPAKIGVTLDVTLDGAIDNPQIAAFLGTGPISLSLSGPVDPTKKSMDVTFDVKAGKIALPGGLRILEGGTTGFVNVASKWYKLPADQLSSDTAKVATDPTATLEAIGNPADLLDDASVVGSETIDGVETDHVTGKLDAAGIAEALSRVAKSSGSADATIDEESIKQIEQALTSGVVDIWVGKEDKQVHRLKFDLVLSIPEDARSESMGITGAKVALTIQSTPIDSVSVSAPSGALSADQLQQDLGTILLSSLAGSQP